MEQEQRRRALVRIDATGRLIPLNGPAQELLLGSGDSELTIATLLIAEQSGWRIDRQVWTDKRGGRSKREYREVTVATLEQAIRARHQENERLAHPRPTARVSKRDVEDAMRTLGIPQSKEDVARLSADAAISSKRDWE